MRISVQPLNPNAAMWHYGSAQNLPASNFIAGTVNFVRPWAEFGVGNIPVVGNIVSVFDALRSSVSGLTSGTRVTNMSADYVFDILENTTWLYGWSSSFGGNWEMFARTSTLSYDMTARAVSATFEGNITMPNAVNREYRGIIEHERRNDTRWLYENGWFYTANINTVAWGSRYFQFGCIVGNNDSKLRITLLSPAIPALAK
ncbi:MAG: hypothetical protein FWG31_02570 [Oscillospiraceae bacterium]|nr:hypothetical protein [Oscillospiraceae bacterium]